VVNHPPAIELLTDFLGMEQVYYLHRGDLWLVSNSVRLLAQIANISAMDPLGVSLFLSMGWVGADRTLRRGIRVIPGGQRWTWNHDEREPSLEAYYPISSLASQRARGLTQPDIKLLADGLVTTCGRLALDYDTLRCPLTGGRDMRFLASLLIHGGIKAQYYTSGNPDSPDVIVGTQIARLFNLSHAINAVTTKSVIEEWETASNRLICQHDGMVSLWQIADVLGQPSSVDHLSLGLWGIGGEIGRGVYSEPNMFLRPSSAKRCSIGYRTSSPETMAGSSATPPRT
jgi:asparagine synthase (glutamine-hydrolysing)